MKDCKTCRLLDTDPDRAGVSPKARRSVHTTVQPVVGSPLAGSRGRLKLRHRVRSLIEAAAASAGSGAGKACTGSSRSFSCRDHLPSDQLCCSSLSVCSHTCPRAVAEPHLCTRVRSAGRPRLLAKARNEQQTLRPPSVHRAAPAAVPPACATACACAPAGGVRVCVRAFDY